eukprot:TRINITY_DN48021_c0_g1_i1.p1 TRINITY_DN48021_c0_g1~~TRINITY_DN48021_c0_g1_i1.p1  ORF type:complete len:110 (-),score=39.59 TRINITY_DN48021_c0_g1_i1:31-330(-)
MLRSLVGSEMCIRDSFYVTGHSVPPEVTRDAFVALEDFFGEPEVDKSKFHVSQHLGFRGWSKMYEQGGYGLDDTDVRQNQELESHCLLYTSDAADEEDR